MNSIFFTVIIPTYNRQQVLNRAIDSVLCQNYKNYELIVVDDGSTDQTEKLLSEYQGKIKTIKTVNQGVSAARNLGVKNSQGEWLAFLDSDDQWFPDKLRSQTDYLLNHPDMEIVHGEEIWIRNGVRVNPMKKHQKSGGDIYIRSLELCLISPSAVVLRRNLFEKMGGFDPNFPVCEDYDLWLKITASYPVGFIETPLIYKYGGAEDQLSRKMKAMDYFRVKSMDRILRQGVLTEEKAKATWQQLIFKSGILLNGYKKYGKLDQYQEIEAIRKYWSTESNYCII